MVFVKNCKFSQVFFLVKICQINCLVTFLHREIGFLDHRNIDYKKSQNLHFSKGSMVFLKNCYLSHFFFLFKKWQTKEFNDVLYRKIGFSRL